MPPSPYAPPKANVSGEAFEEPPQWQRAKWLFSGLWLMLTVLPLWNALLEAPPAPSRSVLLLNSLVALGLAGFLARDMWLLKVRRFPLFVDLSVYAIILGSLVFLLVIKETKAYVWNSLHLDVPAFLMMGGHGA